MAVRQFDIFNNLRNRRNHSNHFQAIGKYSLVYAGLRKRDHGLWHLDLFLGRQPVKGSQVINGRFHTRRRANRLRRTNRLMWKRDEQIFDGQIVWYLAVWKDDFSQTICPSRRTSRRQYDINSHQTDKCQTICPSRRFVRPDDLFVL